VTINEQEATKIVQHSKVITVHELARQTGVKVSAANVFLKESLKKGIIKRAGGFSGHYIYQPISSYSEKTSPGFRSISASTFSTSLPIGVIVLPGTESAIKKHMLPEDEANATSPFLNSFRGLSFPESIDVSKYAMFFPIK
jgi:predicted transcriptional regulator of viral defense system